MGTLEEFKFNDRIVKGISVDGHFKVSVIKTTELVREAVQRHNLSLLSSVLLGRSLTAAALLASDLKGEERIQLRFEGNGPVGMLLAEANKVGEVRGYVRNADAALPEESLRNGVGAGIGVGLLNVTRTLYNESEPRHSTIELIDGDITQDVAFFLAQSEQIPSAVMLDVSFTGQGEVEHAGGLLLQRLPGADDAVIAELQEHLSTFDSVPGQLASGVYIDEIMHRAAGRFAVRELERKPVHFFCRCSRKRFMRGLAMLPLDQLQELGGESQELVCHYCGDRETVTPEEIESLITNARATLN